MTIAFVKAAPDRRVLNHQRGFREILAEGEEVELDRDFRRAIASGDLIEIKRDPAPAKPGKPKPE